MTEDDLKRIEDALEGRLTPGYMSIDTDDVRALIAEVRRLMKAPDVAMRFHEQWSEEANRLLDEGKNKHAVQMYGRSDAAETIAEALSTFIMSGKQPDEHTAGQVLEKIVRIHSSPIIPEQVSCRIHGMQPVVRLPSMGSEAYGCKECFGGTGLG